jgi:uncharacterized repeat protein (TIGR01451 family)
MPTPAALTVTDTLPAGLTFVAAAGTGWSIGVVGQQVTATYGGTLAVGDSATFTVTVAIDATAYPGVTNSATVTMSGDADPSDDVDIDPTPVAAVLDVAIDKRHTSPFAVAQSGVYTLVVRNLGNVPTPATITVTDTLPAGLDFSGAVGAGWTIGASGQVVTATHAAALAPGDSASFMLTVNVDPPAFPAVVNTATVAMAGDDNASNDVDADPASVAGVPDLSLDKRHIAPFIVGQNGAYTLVVRNVGTDVTAGAITVTDTLPAGLTFASGSGMGWSIGASAGIVTATYAGALAPGDSARFTVACERRRRPRSPRSSTRRP